MTGRQGRVLIVEDEVLLAWMMRETLEEAGHGVVALASDHREAVDAALAHRPDLVLMDIRLARGTSGIAAAVEIFERTGIRSIFVTATGDAEKRRRAEPARPLAWLGKPYDPDDLLALLQAALADLPSADRAVAAAVHG